jgi:zinc protease
MPKLLLHVSLLCALAAGLACTPSDPKYAIQYAEKRGVLESNGLRFIIVPDQSTELVQVDVRYEVGSREDPEGKDGLAHLAEHLMFQLKPDGEGSPPLQHFVNQLSTFYNAYTSWDTTHYMTTSRAENLEALLKIEAMRIYYGCQTISEEEFLREREVVRNEIRQRTGTAEGQIGQLVLSSVYPKGHAYERGIGGDDRSLTSITLQDACDFLARYYVPERATVIIAGGVDFDVATDLVQKWFGKLERKVAGPRRRVDPVKPRPGRQEIALDIERPVVAVSWPLPDAYTKEGDAAGYGIRQVYFRTANKAREYDFAYSVEPAWLGGNDAPVFSILIELRGMGKLDEALDFVWKGARQAHRGWDDVGWEALDARRKLGKADFIAGLERLAGRTNLIGDLVQFSKEVQFASAQEYILHELAKYEQYDGQLIASAVKKYLDPKRATVVVFKPSEEGIKGDVRAQVKFETRSHDTPVEPEVDPREARVPLKVATELKSLGQAVRYELGNGMKVVLLPTESTMPLVAARLSFDVGTAHAENPLAAAWAADYLIDKFEDEAVRRTGVNIRGGADRDQTYFYTRAINIYLDVVIKGIERMVKAAEYSQQGIEDRQKLVRGYLSTRDAQAQTEYQRQVDSAVWGGEHPYARVTLLDHTRGFGVDALNRWRRKHYSAGNATLIVAGNFDVDKAKAHIAEAFGGWSRGHVDQPVAADPRPRSGPEYIGVVRKEGPQMQVTIAYPAPAGIDGEQGARMVLTEMMNARMGDIRFKLGATYGAYAFRATGRGPGAYLMGGGVDAERAGEALRAMRDGIQMLRDGGEQWDIDFVRARRKLIQNLLGESTVSLELVGRLATIAKYGLDADYYNRLLQMIAAVSPAQLKALIKRELDPAKEIIVTTADKPTIERAFSEAGLTSIRIVEPDYR